MDASFRPGPAPAGGVIKIGRAGVEFQIYLPYIPAYKTTFKVQKPNLKNLGDLIQRTQKSYLNFYMKIFFILYEKCVGA